jgi:pimeloyl-ACP methyl ester carboxylesterase
MADSEMSDNRFKTFDGTELYFTVSGAGPIDFILCDGIGCDGFVWRYLRPELERRGRVIHMHMRGHGLSGSPDNSENLDIRHLADDWSVLLAGVRQNPTVVIGHSMGVQVALELWRRHPQHVGALVLMCGSFQNPVATFHDDTVMETMLPYLRRATIAGGNPLKKIWRTLVKLPVAFHVARLTEVHPDLARRQDFGPYLEHLAHMDPTLFFRMLAGAGAHSADGYLDEIDVSTLVVAGEDDRFTPAYLSEEMAGRIPDGRLLVIEDGTHTAPIEHPTRTNLSITKFIDGLSLEAD